MRTKQELDLLREQAVALRRQGRSRRQIKEILGPMGNSTLDDALKGEPAPEWTRRPNAKDGLRDKARELRTQGLDYDEIAAALGVAKSSVSLWVRDLPIPPRLPSHRRPAQQQPVPQDRRLVSSDHERWLTPAWL